MNFIISLIFIQQIFAIPTNDQSKAIFDPSDEHLLDEEAKYELEKIKKEPKREDADVAGQLFERKTFNLCAEIKVQGRKARKQRINYHL